MNGKHLIIAAVAIAFGACWMQAAAVYSDDRYDGLEDPITAQAGVQTAIVQDASIPASVALFN